MTRVACLVAVLAWLAHAPRAHAQPKAVAEELAKIQASVEELRAKTVEIPTLAAAVQELSVAVSELERRLAELERSQASIPDAVARLDELTAKAASLEHQVQALGTQLADVEQAAAAPTSAAGGSVAYKDKYSFATADGRFSLAISGYLHARYQLRADADEIIDSTLRVRRARVGLAGQLGSPDLGYKLVLSAIRDIPLLDYHMDYKLHDAAIVRVGQYKTQFTREFMTSSTKRAFLEEPLATDLVRYDRDIQVGVYGTFLGDRLGYYAGVGNGAGLNKVNDNLDMSMTLRVDASALGERFKLGYGDVKRTARPALMIGAGVMHDLVPMPTQVGNIAINTDVDGDGERDNVRVVSASVDAAFRYQGFEAVLEAVMRRESFGTILEHADNAGLVAALGGRDDHTYVNVFGQATYLLPQRVGSYSLMLGARVSRARVPFLGVGGRSSRVPKGENAMDADVLVALYNDRGQRFLTLDYGAQHYSAIVDSAGDPITEDITEHRVILETQLLF